MCVYAHISFNVYIFMLFFIAARWQRAGRGRNRGRTRGHNRRGRVRDYGQFIYISYK